MSGSGRKVVATVAEAVKGTIADMSKNRRGYTDVQGAPRFPIKLPVAFKSAVNQGGAAAQIVGEKTIETENISANGVLFRMDADAVSYTHLDVYKRQDVRLAAEPAAVAE